MTLETIPENLSALNGPFQSSSGLQRTLDELGSRTEMLNQAIQQVEATGQVCGLQLRTLGIDFQI